MGPALDELNLDPKDFGPLLISQKFKWPQEKISKWLDMSVRHAYTDGTKSPSRTWYTKMSLL